VILPALVLVWLQALRKEDEFAVRLASALRGREEEHARRVEAVRAEVAGEVEHAVRRAVEATEAEMRGRAEQQVLAIKAASEAGLALALQAARREHEHEVEEAREAERRKVRG
jgi:hypothetical protein